MIVAGFRLESAEMAQCWGDIDRLVLISAASHQELDHHEVCNLQTSGLRLSIGL